VPITGGTARSEEIGHLVADEHGEHGGERHDGHGQHEHDPEQAPELRDVVAVTA
jgi:hypothetical protein